MNIPNLKPADELFAIRERINELSRREAELRQLLIDDTGARYGDNVIAEVTTSMRRRFDRKAAEKALGPLNAYDTETETITIRVKPRVSEYE